MTGTHKHQTLLMLILLVALALRLVYALSQSTDVYFNTGGDSGWYLANGLGFFTGHEKGWIRGVTFYLSTIPTAPLYIIFAGIWQTFLSDDAAIHAIRIVQSLFGVATCYLAHRLARTLTDDPRAGLLAAVALALHPAFVIEPANIATETLYIFFITAGLFLYVEYVVRPGEAAQPWQVWLMVAAVGLAFGLATLTRAVALLFPLGIAIHMMMVGWRANRRLWGQKAVLLLLIYAVTVSTWTFYNLRFGRLVIGSDQFVPALWRGAVADEGEHRNVDERFLGESIDDDGCVDCGVRIDDTEMLADAAATIGSDPAGFVRLRLIELATSYLQPHGTVALGGESLRELTLNWLREDRTLSGLLAVIQGDNFWPKLGMYLFHYGGILSGLMGMWLARRRWRLALPLIGFVAYTTLIHIALIALPRYIFPAEVVFWIFAATVLVQDRNRLRQERGETASAVFGPQPPAPSP